MCAHFTLVSVFARPNSEEKKKLNYYAEWYVYPYFTQNWNLFVPPPTGNYRLFVEYEVRGKHHVDIFEEMRLQHQCNRLKGYGTVLLAFTNSIHYFESNTTLQKPLNGPVTNDLNFKILEHSAINYLQYTRGIILDKIKLQLVVNDSQSKTSRVYFN